MRLLFKANINDIHDSRKFYRKGQEYDFDEKRGKELLTALPNLITRVDGKSTANKGGRKSRGDGKSTDKNEPNEVVSSSDNINEQESIDDKNPDAEDTKESPSDETPADTQDDEKTDSNEAEK